MSNTYEVRFGASSEKKKKVIQDYRIFTVKAESFADALDQFVQWANDGRQKTDFKGRPYKFTSYPVTEANAVSVVRIM